jgi:hypothetical protein
MQVISMTSWATVRFYGTRLQVVCWLASDTAHDVVKSTYTTKQKQKNWVLFGTDTFFNASRKTHTTIMSDFSRTDTVLCETNFPVFCLAKRKSHSSFVTAVSALYLWSLVKGSVTRPLQRHRQQNKTTHRDINGIQ